jgi:hypothetical protein
MEGRSRAKKDEVGAVLSSLNGRRPLVKFTNLPAVGRAGALAWLDAAVVRPTVPLLPWIAATAIFHVFLSTGQGAVLARELRANQTSPWILVAALAVAHLIALSGAMLAQVASFARVGPRADTGPGSFHILVRGGWSAVVSCSFGVLVAFHVGALAVSTTVGCLVALSFAGVAWVSANAGRQSSPAARLLEFVQAHRLTVTLFAAFLALLPLAVGAYVAQTSPMTLAALGPLLVTLLGLSSVATLLGCLVVTAPLCVGRPWLGIAAIAGLQVWTGTRPLAVDHENPLLRDRRVSISVSQAADATCPPPAQSFRGSVVKAFAARPTSTREAASKAAYLVSAEGGGIRAAYWTAMSLASLDVEIGGEISRNVALLSGVSGGSLGIAAWVAAQEASEEPNARLELLDRFLASDFLSPLLGGLLFLDIPRILISPLWFGATRDQVFEKAIADQWFQMANTDFFYRPLLRPCLRGFRAPPALFFNATDMETGGYAPLTTTLFDGWPANGVPGTRFRFQDTTLATISMAQAVHISARFPYVSPGAVVGLDLHEFPKSRERDLLINPNAMADPAPPASAPATAPRRALRVGILVDGGYYDNTGLRPVLDALHVVHAFRANPPSETSRAAAATRFVSLHFSNDAGSACVRLPPDWQRRYSPLTVQLLSTMGPHRQCLSEADMLETARAPVMFQWFTTPLSAILNVREGHLTTQRREFLLMSTEAEPRIEFSVHDEITEGYGFARPPVLPLVRPDAYKWATATGPEFLSQLGRAVDGLSARHALTRDQATTLLKQWREWDGVVRARIAEVPCPFDAAELKVPLGWTLSSRNRAVLRCLAKRAVYRSGLTVPDHPPVFSRYLVAEREQMMLLNAGTPSGVSGR